MTSPIENNIAANESNPSKSEVLSASRMMLLTMIIFTIGFIRLDNSYQEAKLAQELKTNKDISMHNIAPDELNQSQRNLPKDGAKKALADALQTKEHCD